jgi:hypothetical protein
MTRFYKAAANIVFCLNLLVLFLLFFRERLVFPAWVQSLGRMHPLLLHLPIGMLVLLSLLLLFRRYFDGAALRLLVLFALYVTAIMAALTALMGLVLSGEGGYSEGLLRGHLFTGIGVTLLTWVLLLLAVHAPQKLKVFHGMVVLTLVCLIVTGHLGASLTHGENFVWAPLQSRGSVAVVTDSTSLYEAAVYPVFERKCTNCHNEKKAKGDLVMTSVDKLLEGGEHGRVWKAGDPHESLLLKRIHLPEEHDDHMPPAGKPQLTTEEIRLLHLWIAGGADTHTAWTKFNPQDSLRLLAQAAIQRTRTATHQGPRYTFAHAPQKTLHDLNTPFLTVVPFAGNEPALKADFFLRQAFDKARLHNLTAIKEQLVILNLANMPVTDQDCAILREFTNLEKLILNNTAISGKDLSFLKSLNKLKSLSLAGTAVTAQAIRGIATLPALKEVFTWNTAITVQEIDALHKDFPGIMWNTGFVPDEKEVLQLTPPLLVNENTILEAGEAIELKNNLPGAMIRYTLDGSEPDSTSSPVYKDPISIDGFVNLKARTCKEHWRSSRVMRQYIFKKGYAPTTAALLTQPPKEYGGEGITTIINNKKGTADNHRDIAWIGYRKEPLIGEFYFKEPPPLKAINISYALNIDGYLMPPALVELWAGTDAKNAKRIQQIKPAQPSGIEPPRIEVITVPIQQAGYHYYKIVLSPVPKLPAWHRGKGDLGWVFVDEVFFN